MEFASILTIDEISKIKLNLMSRDLALQMHAVSWITKNLNIMSNDDRERFIDTLITTDVITYLCEKIRCSHGQLFVSMLHIVEKLVQSVNFYKRKLAKRAIDSIVGVASVMAKKMEAHEETLALVAYTIYVVMDGAVRFVIPWDTVCDNDRMIILVDNLNPRCSSKYVLRLSVARILCIVMENIDPRSDETTSSLFAPFKNSLRSVSAIVIQCNDPTNLELAQSSMAIVCAACAIGTRFFKSVKGDNFAAEITRVMIEAVIPLFQGMRFKAADLETNVKNLVHCLDRIFQLKNCHKDLTDLLTTNGYLKYLLLIPSQSLRKSMSSLISQTIARLCENDFSKIDGPEHLGEFRDFVNKGILAMPSMVERFENIVLVLETEGAASDAFLILCYHHAHKTHEYNLVPLSSMILKVITLSDFVLVPILKAAWFLFAVSSLERSATNSVCYYGAAAKHLAYLLQRHDLKKCYTHSPAIVEHSLDCESFPTELQYEIVRLWLDFDGNHELIVTLKNTEFINECLLRIVETCTEKLVKRASKVIAEMKCNENRWAKIITEVWKILPRTLGSCSAESATNVKGLLKLAHDTKPDVNCPKIRKHAIVDWTKILQDDKIDDELKILLLRYVHTSLQISCSRNSPEVVAFCVRNVELMIVLRDKGLARENFELSGHSIYLLAYIVDYQQKYQIECDAGEVTKIEPLKMLVLISRSNHKLFLAAVRLLNHLLSNRNNVNCTSALILSDFKNFEAAEKALFAWYMKLHQLLHKTQSEDWMWVYRCLIAVLEFCDNEEFSETLKKLCDYAGTYGLVRWTIHHRYADSIFFEFADVWLRHGIKHRSESMLQASYARRFEILSICDNEFDEIIQTLTDYRKRSKNFDDIA